MRRWTALMVAAATAFALVVSACGGGNGPESSSTRHQGVAGAPPTSLGQAPAPASTSANQGGTVSGISGSGTVEPRSTTDTTGPSSTTTTTSRSNRTSATGVYGYVTTAPSCPVEQQAQPCPPKPVSAEIDARGPSGATTAAARSDSAGYYSLDLAPGSYTLIVISSASWPRCPDTPATVQPGAATRADISCDSGIR